MGVFSPTGDAVGAGGSGPLYRGARTYSLRPLGPGAEQASGDAPPASLTLIFDDEDRSDPSQIIVDHVPIPADHWSFDGAAGVLSWDGSSAGKARAGRLQFEAGGRTATGSASVDGAVFQLEAELPPIAYDCSVALGTGAYVDGVGPTLALHWDVNGPGWTGATWVSSALQFTYQMRPISEVGQTIYEFYVRFTDLQTGAVWTPAPQTFTCLVDDQMIFRMSLSAGYAPPPDARGGLPDPEACAIVSVFPYQIGFQLDATAVDLAGAMLTLSDAQNGTVLGVQGTTASPSVAGFYALSGSDPDAMFAVHDAGLHILGRPIEGARVAGTALSWSGLSPDLVAASGLPPEGTIDFGDDGSTLRLRGGEGGRRLSEADLAGRTSRPSPPVAGIQRG